MTYNHTHIRNTNIEKNNNVKCWQEYVTTQNSIHCCDKSKVTWPLWEKKFVYYKVKQNYTVIVVVQNFWKKKTLKIWAA